MPTPRQQIEARVDEAIAKGALPPAERQATIEFLSKDDSRAQFFAQELAGGSYFGTRAKQEAEARRKSQEDIERQRAAVQAEKQALEAWSRDARAEVDKARAIEDEHKRLIAENAALRQVAKDYNIEEELTVQPQRRTDIPMDQRIQPTVDGKLRDVQTGRFVSEERATQAFQELIGMTSKAMSVQAEHQQLFGAPLTDSIIEEAIAAGNPDIKGYWEAKYNVPAKRAQLAEEQRTREIARIREEERNKVLAEMAIDPSKFVGASPGYTPQSSPLANAYMQSRASEMNPVNGVEGTQVIPPEKRSDVQTMRERIAAGVQSYNKYFNIDGTPRQGVRPPGSYAESMAHQDS
jgi:hypothetical protein